MRQWEDIALLPAPVWSVSGVCSSGEMMRKCIETVVKIKSLLQYKCVLVMIMKLDHTCM